MARSGTFALLAAGLLAAGAGTARAEVFFTGIGSSVRSVSGDGRVVGGSSGRGALIWTREAGIVEIPAVGPNLLRQHQASVAAASWDGSRLAGGTSTPDVAFVEAVLWEGLVPELLGVPAPAGFSLALDMSGDGASIVGSAFYWNEDTGLVVFDDMSLSGISRDGSIAVGHRGSPNILPAEAKAIAWTPEDGPMDLGGLPGRAELEELSIATAASADGSVIVGYVREGGTERHAFRWTAETGTIDLDAIAGAPFRGEARDVSDDGAIVVGQSFELGPFLWDPLHGARSLESLLEDLGVDLYEWELGQVLAISADGRTIVGTGEYPRHASQQRGWVVVLPHRPGDVVRIDVLPRGGVDRVTPGRTRIALFGARYFDVSEIDEASLSFGPVEAAPLRVGRPRDVDRDGYDDVVLTFRTGALGLPLGETEACLEGRTLPGMPFEGCDAVRVGGCARGSALAVLVPLLLLVARRPRLGP